MRCSGLRPLSLTPSRSRRSRRSSESAGVPAATVPSSLVEAVQRRRPAAAGPRCGAVLWAIRSNQARNGASPRKRSRRWNARRKTSCVTSSHSGSPTTRAVTRRTIDDGGARALECAQVAPLRAHHEGVIRVGHKLHEDRPERAKSYKFFLFCRVNTSASDTSLNNKEAVVNLFSAVNVGDSLQTGLDSFFGFLPKLLGFVIVLVIGWIIAKVVKTAVTKLGQKIGLDRALHSGTTGQYVDRVAPNTSPSGLIGTLAYWFIFLGRGRHRRVAARHRRAGQLRRRDRRLPAERDRRGPDLRRRRRHRRRDRRPHRPHHG